MCNLSEGIFERGKLTGAINTYLDGVATKEYIMKKFNLSEEEFEEAVKNIAN